MFISKILFSQSFPVIFFKSLHLHTFLAQHPFILQYAQQDIKDTFAPFILETLELRKQRKKSLLRRIGVPEELIESYFQERRPSEQFVAEDLPPQISKPEEATTVLEGVQSGKAPFRSLERLMEWYDFLNEDPEEHGVETEESPNDLAHPHSVKTFIIITVHLLRDLSHYYFSAGVNPQPDLRGVHPVELKGKRIHGGGGS